MSTLYAIKLPKIVIVISSSLSWNYIVIQKQYYFLIIEMLIEKAKFRGTSRQLPKVMSKTSVTWPKGPETWNK